MDLPKTEITIIALAVGALEMYVVFCLRCLSAELI